MTRHLIRTALALVVVAAALIPPTGLEAQPFFHFQNFYYTGCTNLVQVGGEEFGCDPYSWGTQAGDWKEKLVTRCSDDAVVEHAYYEWCGSSWVQVTQSQFGHGCLC